MEFNKILFVFLGLLLLGSGLVMAISNASVSDVAPLTRWGGDATAGSITTEGGNITSANVAANTLTDRWAGFFGNVTGAIYLTDNSSVSGGTINNYLFMWTVDSSTTGYVCVSESDNFPFGSAVATTAGKINTAWNFSAATDNATNTFTTSTCDITFNNPYVEITGTVNAKNATNSAFETCAIDDGGSDKPNFAFCTAINQSGVNYLNQDADYELIVPTRVGDATETYYFYAELN